MVRNFIPVLVEDFVAWANATYGKARAVKERAQMVGAEAALFVDLAADVLNFLEVWLPVCSVVMAVP